MKDDASAAVLDTVRDDVRCCCHVDDVPYTPMQAGAPTTWQHVPCKRNAMAGSEYCRHHAWMHGGHVATNAGGEN